jgi:hypothetical protein
MRYVPEKLDKLPQPTLVRWKEVPSLMIESLMLKKKRECEREEEEGGTQEGL